MLAKLLTDLKGQVSVAIEAVENGAVVTISGPTVDGYVSKRYVFGATEIDAIKSTITTVL